MHLLNEALKLIHLMFWSTFIALQPPVMFKYHTALEQNPHVTQECALACIGLLTEGTGPE